MKQLKVMHLYVRGMNLLNLDVGRDKSDTYCILKMKWQNDQKDWLEVDQTEVVFDSLDPNWEHHFSVVFNLGQILQLRFEVNDKDTAGKVELIGYFETTLAQLMAQSRIVENHLKGPHEGPLGAITVTVQEKVDSQYNVHLKFRVHNLPKKNNMFECNFATTYFMELWKGPAGKMVKFHESDLWVDNFDKDFNLKFTDAEICNGDENMPLVMKFISRNQYRMENEETCRLETTLNEMI
jgi:hypothetical protein